MTSSKRTTMPTRRVNSAGTEVWYLNGKVHRTDGPAIIHPEGCALWLRNGKLHRLDGPAITHADGSEEWWVHGVRYEPPPPCPECGKTEGTFVIDYG